MTELEKREKIRVLIEELVTFNVKEERESKLSLEIDELSPDPAWSDYIFWSDDYLDDSNSFLMDKFLDKIFSYKPNVIHL